jgi:5-methylcytosine-specific restriction protein A
MWEGNNRSSTKEHRLWAKRVLARDKYICQLQGTTCLHRATEADHIIEWSDGGRELMSNGQAVCVNCHRVKTSAHANSKRWAHRRGVTPKHPGLL